MEYVPSTDQSVFNVLAQIYVTVPSTHKSKHDRSAQGKIWGESGYHVRVTRTRGALARVLAARVLTDALCEACYKDCSPAVSSPAHVVSRAARPTPSMRGYYSHDTVLIRASRHRMESGSFPSPLRRYSIMGFQHSYSTHSPYLLPRLFAE